GGQIVSNPSPSDPLFGIAPKSDASALWISQAHSNRVFRVRNPLSATPLVDVVLGQLDSTSFQCNRGGAARPGALANSLCRPGSLSLDRQNNLWVSDHSLEFEGNVRLLGFDAALFPANNASMIYAPSATKIFPDIATWTPAFSSTNRMVVGFNPYWN